MTSRRPSPPSSTTSTPPTCTSRGSRREGFLPTTLSGSEQLADDEALAPFLEVLPDAQFYPSTNPEWSAADSAFKALFGQLDSDKSAQDVLAEIQAQVDAG